MNLTADELRQGESVYRTYCNRCHNPDLNGVKSGAIPDLRRASAATHATFEQIVIGGARRTLGMPSFAKDITGAQVKLIQGYVLEQARNVAQARPTQGGH